MREEDFDDRIEARKRIVLEMEELTSNIIACAIKVHKMLGPGFLESIYQAALPIELQKVGLQIEEQKEINIHYDGKIIGTHRLDLVVNDQVILELKTVTELNEAHKSQLVSYLKATGYRLGLLLNFSKPKLQIKRVIL